MATVVFCMLFIYNILRDRCVAIVRLIEHYGHASLLFLLRVLKLCAIVYLSLAYLPASFLCTISVHTFRLKWAWSWDRFTCTWTISNHDFLAHKVLIISILLKPRAAIREHELCVSDWAAERCAPVESNVTAIQHHSKSLVCSIYRAAFYHVK